jgi:hypothetical protein
LLALRCGGQTHPSAATLIDNSPMHNALLYGITSVYLLEDACVCDAAGLTLFTLLLLGLGLQDQKPPDETKGRKDELMTQCIQLLGSYRMR